MGLFFPKRSVSLYLAFSLTPTHTQNETHALTRTSQPRTLSHPPNLFLAFSVLLSVRHVTCSTISFHTLLSVYIVFEWYT